MGLAGAVKPPKHRLGLIWVLVLMIPACERSEEAASPEAQTTFPVAGPSNGWVAFAAVPGLVSAAGGNGPGDIYLVREGGQVVRPGPTVGSVGDGRHQFCPAFSPDGSMLAYVDLPFGPDAAPGPSAIVVSHFSNDGSLSGPRTVIDLGPPDEALRGSLLTACPKWSPDGTKLAYLYEFEFLQVVTLDGEEPTELDLFCAGLPVGICPGWWNFAWSPDGSVIALSGPAGLVLIPAQGGESHLLLPTTTSEISWSPDGTRLVAGVPGGIKVIGVDGTEYDLSKPAESPVWSPDGSRIAYLTPGAPSGRGTLVVSSPDGAAKRAILLPDPPPGGETRAGGPPAPNAAMVGIGMSSWPIWSPDGTRLLFVAFGADGWGLVSVSATDDAPPVFLTPLDDLLYNTGASWLSWQPLFP